MDDTTSSEPAPGLGALMGLAQRGHHDEAIAHAERLVHDQRLRTEERVLALYVLGTALMFAGRLGEASHAADQCHDEADSIHSAGWQANALALRAQVLAAEGDIDGAVTDLIAAEVVLEACSDLGLRNWAHSALGTGYASLRLFELALPHFELAPTIEEQPVDLPDGPTIDIFNLADLHVRWAAELERVGLDDEAMREEHEAHLAAARRWIAEGDHIDGLADDEVWAPAFARMRACVDSSLDPDAAVDALGEQRTADLVAGDLYGAIQSSVHLARALRLVERPEEAVAAAREAVAMLGDEIDVATRLEAYHQLHEAQVAAGLPGAAELRGYAKLTAALLWGHRVRSFEGVRARRDLAVLESQHEFSNRLAREDALTGAFNRRALDEWFDEHQEGPATVVLIDLDHFKSVNDEYGNAAGDELLVRVAQTLTRVSRTGDLVARVGGDEFVIAIDGGIPTYELCRRIEAGIAAIEVSDIAPGLEPKASSGAASVAVGQSTKDLLRRADKDMVESKRGLAEARAKTTLAG